MYQVKPFIKWAGGKQRYIKDIIASMPSSYNRYFEPFLGGGSVLLGLQPKTAYVNDNNSYLINCYSQIKHNYDETMAWLKALEPYQGKWAFYCLRERFIKKQLMKCLDAEACALFIYLNKTCFNGLYRENNQGLFNTTWGRTSDQKSNVFSVDEDNIKQISLYLQNVQISNSDFEKFCEMVQPGDFVYFDSPYIPLNRTSYFTKYTKEDFKTKDHRRLFYLFRRLDRLGAKCLSSNHDTELTRELYANYNIRQIQCIRTIGQHQNTKVSEVLISNY